MNAYFVFSFILVFVHSSHSAHVPVKLFSNDDSANRGKFNSFKTKNSKAYKDTTEESSRYSIFVSNLQLADDRNLLESATIHGVTKFSDLTEAEFKDKYLSTFPKRSAYSMEEIAMRDANEKSVSSFRMAAVVDWTDTLTTPVKNQGYCGSCWAFAAIEQVETDAIRMFPSVYTTSNIRLSAQQVTSCSTSNFGCSGGWTDTAFTYIKTAGGLTSEALYPYTSGAYPGVTGTCTNTATLNKVVTISSYSSVYGESAIAAQVASTGPVVVYVYASTWSTYTGGIMTVASCSSTAGINHAVQAISCWSICHCCFVWRILETQKSMGHKFWHIRFHFPQLWY